MTLQGLRSFVLFGTRQYGVGVENKRPTKSQLFFMLKAVAQHRLK